MGSLATGTVSQPSFRMMKRIVAGVVGVAATVFAASPEGWERIEVEPGGRIDAIADFGGGVVVLGTRLPNPSNVYRSPDLGKTWERVANVGEDDYITCVAAGRGAVGYILTGAKVHLWKTEDDGLTWHDMGRINDADSGTNFAEAYGMVVTERGTILVADTDAGGGRISRSTDGGKTWTVSAPISPLAIYRLQPVGDGIIVNGWAGNIYKSTDDGQTWRDCGKLMDSFLYAIDYLGDNAALIGTESGHVFRSEDNGDSWSNMGHVGDSADDFVSLGGGRAIFTTYRDSKRMHFTADGGRTWSDWGDVATGAEGDWFDHVILAQHDGKSVIVGGTNKGFVLRQEVN
ncbi:MAG: hypothetical protein SynsKO_01380 [Synoicihabitans sp.]